jgi:hypothetical protein
MHLHVNSWNAGELRCSTGAQQDSAVLSDARFLPEDEQSAVLAASAAMAIAN